MILLSKSEFPEIVNDSLCAEVFKLRQKRENVKNSSLNEFKFL